MWCWPPAGHVHAKTILTAETRDGAGQCDQLRSCLQAQTCTFNIVPVRHRGEPPGHTGDRTHTGHTRAHKGTRTTQTNITTSQTHQHTTRTSARRPKPRSVPVLRRYVFRRTFVREQSSRRTFSLYGCFSALRLHVSHLRPGLYCIVLFSRLCCLRVVCINMNRARFCHHNEGMPLLCASNDSSLDARIASGIGQRRGGTNMGNSQCPRGAPGHGEHVARTSRF